MSSTTATQDESINAIEMVSINIEGGRQADEAASLLPTNELSSPAGCETGPLDMESLNAAADTPKCESPTNEEESSPSCANRVWSMISAFPGRLWNLVDTRLGHCWTYAKNALTGFLKAVIPYCWKLIKLALAIQMVIDMVLDGIQTAKYYRLRGAYSGYFIGSILTWLMTPLGYLAWSLYTGISAHSKTLKKEYPGLATQIREVSAVRRAVYKVA